MFANRPAVVNERLHANAHKIEASQSGSNSGEKFAIDSPVVPQERGFAHQRLVVKMSDTLDGERWKSADDHAQQTAVRLQVRSRAEQQSWLNQQYLRRKIGLAEWRKQFDICSFMNGDGSFPTELE